MGWGNESPNASLKRSAKQHQVAQETIGRLRGQVEGLERRLAETERQNLRLQAEVRDFRSALRYSEADGQMASDLLDDVRATLGGPIGCWPPVDGKQEASGPDPFTFETRLCDDEGMVSEAVAFQSGSSPNLTLTYLDVHNNLRRHTRGADSLITKPFGCTGSAHLAGEHIRCTSPAHAMTTPRTDHYVAKPCPER